MAALRRYEEPPRGALELGREHFATLHTDAGEVQLRLLPELAPRAARSFAFLAQEGFYDGCTFHRVVPGFIAQAGDPTGRGSGGPGYRLPDEISERVFVAGTVGLANPVPGQNGSQFFITLADARQLDGRFTAFAEVTAGLDLLQALPARAGVEPGEPPGLRIRSVTVAAEAEGEDSPVASGPATRP